MFAVSASWGLKPHLQTEDRLTASLGGYPGASELLVKAHAGAVLGGDRKDLAFWREAAPDPRTLARRYVVTMVTTLV